MSQPSSFLSLGTLPQLPGFKAISWQPSPPPPGLLLCGLYRSNRGHWSPTAALCLSGAALMACCCQLGREGRDGGVESILERVSQEVEWWSLDCSNSARSEREGLRIVTEFKGL